MAEQGRLALNNEINTDVLKPEKGVKGISILSKIPLCDPSAAVYPEYMHGIMGLIKRFMKLWFETDLNCNLKDHRNEINNFLRTVKVPDYLTRCPETTDDYPSWKANECRTFLIYLSLIIFAMFMSRQYFQHWLLFVSAIYLLLQEDISENDLQTAEIMLNMFLRDFSNLYRADDYSYNLHNLSHYCLTVRRFGNLFSNSTFEWENLNGTVRLRIHGTKNQGIELVKTLQLCQGVEILRARYETSDNDRERYALFRNKITDCKFTATEKNLLAASNLTPENAYFRAVFMPFGEVFTCCRYQRQRQNNNNTVCYVDSGGVKRYGEIDCFVECLDSTKMAFVKFFVIEHAKMFIHVRTNFVVKHIIPIADSPVVHLILLGSHPYILLSFISTQF